MSISIGLNKKMGEIGERLAQEVERIGGVTAAAQALEVARNTLYNWMEKENIPANKLLELGKLGADVSFILSGTRVQPPPQESAANDPLAQQKAQVKALVDRLDDARKLSAVQDSIEESERVKRMEKELAELRQRAG